MNRRDFIKGSALLAAGAVSVGAQAAEKRVVRAAIVGCGGRGRGNGRGISDGEPKVPKDFWNQGAIGNMMYAAKLLCEQGVDVEVKPVAFADYFLARALDTAKKFGVDEKNAYGGANGYKEIMKRDDVDVVILTTPLNFRPRHTMAAIESGKHVFAEKGVAVDAPGVRLMIAAARKAEEKKLTIVCGTQRRHQRGYLLQAKALKDGTHGPDRDDERPHQERKFAVLQPRLQAYARGLRAGGRRADAGVRGQPVPPAGPAMARSAEA